MGLVVAAQVIRELITDGEYLVECIEQRERGKVTVAFALRSRVQPYIIQIETMDTKIGGLFRALLNEKSPRAERPALVTFGSQAVPVIEVDSVPADTGTARKRRKQGINQANGSQPKEPTKLVQRRRSARQLALMPQDAAHEPVLPSPAPKRRRTPRTNDGGATC